MVYWLYFKQNHDNQVDGGWAAMGYNDRPYANRGWCVLENAVLREAVGRAHQPGFEAIRELVEAAAAAVTHLAASSTAPDAQAVVNGHTDTFMHSLKVRAHTLTQRFVARGS